MRKWYDIESDEIVTETMLYNEYIALESIDNRGLTFAEYIRNCTDKNGTLVPV